MKPSIRAFTLVELAVVLVIIGLLVGGVLVGQDLIRNSAIKGTAAQIEKFDLAGAAFRTKFRSVAGDMAPAKAARFGFLARSGSAGQGDDNGRVENVGASGAPGGLGGESALYWRDLWDSKLIGVEYNLADGTVVDTSGFVAPATTDLMSYIPPAKLRGNTFFHIYGYPGINYYHIGQFASGDATGTISWTSGMTPMEALGMDTKLDDGNPLRGTTRAATNQEVLDNGAAAGVGVCVDTNPTTPTYNTTTTTYANAVTCQLRVRAQF